MSINRAQSQYLRIFTSGGSDHYLFQNFYVNSTVSLSGKSYQFFPFTWSGVSESSAFDGQSVSVTFPATPLAVTAFEAAAESRYLCELKAFDFNRLLGITAPQSGQVLTASFIGLISRMNGSFTELTVELGSTLVPVGAKVPPRTATNSLIGVPLQR